MGRTADGGRCREWEDRFRRYMHSGLSVTEFCEWEGISTATFYNWRKKLAAGGGPVRSSDRSPDWNEPPLPIDRTSFLPVRVTPTLVATSQTSRVEIRLTNGAIILVPGDDADAIETVISAVGQLSAVAGCDAGGLNDREEDIAC